MNALKPKAAIVALVASAALAACTTSTRPGPAAGSTFDAALARSVGADEYGMRNYVLVLLRTGPKKMPAGPERDAMFRGHFANIKRLAEAGPLVLAGPFDGVDGWRGMFVFAVADIAEAEKLVATDPVIIHGEMVAEYHKYYGSAALMMLRDGHQKVAKKQF